MQSVPRMEIKNGCADAGLSARDLNPRTTDAPGSKKRTRKKIVGRFGGDGGADERINPRNGRRRQVCIYRQFMAFIAASRAIGREFDTTCVEGHTDLVLSAGSPRNRPASVMSSEVGQTGRRSASNGSELKKLLVAAKGGSDSALGRALTACRPGLLAVAQKRISPRLRRVVGASDIVQDTFVNATKAFRSFRGERANEFVKWLGKILSNRLAQIVRRNSARASGAAAISDQRVSVIRVGPRRRDGEPTPSGLAEVDELARMVRSGLSRLSERDQQILQLRLGDGLKFAQIGGRLGITANGARMSFLRAAERLRDQMKSAG
jgi:RNA polymerase sigma-70 factor, ECF subfamily